MEINQETINQFLSLDDEELKKAFRSIASALGMNERFAAANTQRFKRNKCIFLRYIDNQNLTISTVFAMITFGK